MKVITIGRTPKNDIVIDDVQVSSNHLQIVQDENGYCSAVDLGSTNGTFVNGRRIIGEVRLQPNDVVQIGNSILPWQNYLNSPPTTNPFTAPESKSKRTVWYIAVAVVLLLLVVGGGIAAKVIYDKKQEEIEAENKAKAEVEQLQQETGQKEAEAKRLQEEADELRQKALISQSNEDKRLAKEAQNRANTAKKDSEEARMAQQKAEKERDEAKKAKQAAETARIEAERRAKAAEMAKDNADLAREKSELAVKQVLEKAKRDSIARVNAEKSESEKVEAAKMEAKEKAEQGKNFWPWIANFNDDDYKAVCSELGYSTVDAKKVLEQKFIDADQQEVQTIVRVVTRYYREKF